MNTALALEIYRGLWVVESSRVDALKNVLRDARVPGAVYDPSDRLNTFSFLDIKTGGIGAEIVSSSESKTANKIAVTSVNGVITKSGGMSSRGMQELSSNMIAADNDPEVIGHIVEVDSPGGSAVGMKYMQKTMQSLTKPKVTIVTRQGMAASGGWGILSEGDYVYAESEDAEVGCHGVMWSVSGVPNGEKDGNGELNLTVISATSPNKNEATLTAINTGDTSLMQKEVNELHLDFQASTKAARPNIKAEQMTGAMYPAGTVVGTMIDAIGSKSDAINKIFELSKSNDTFNKKSKTTLTAMTPQEIQSSHPEAYAAIFSAGVAAEHSRVAVYLAHHATDPVSVIAGIKSKEPLSAEAREELLVKASSAAHLKNLHQDSPPPIVAPESSGKTEPVLTEKQKKDKAEFDAAFGKHKVEFPTHFQSN